MRLYFLIVSQEFKKCVKNVASLFKTKCLPALVVTF